MFQGGVRGKTSRRISAFSYVLFIVESARESADLRGIPARMGTSREVRRPGGSHLDHTAFRHGRRSISDMPYSNFSRRSFIAMSAVLPWAWRGVAAGLAPSKSITVGLELYSVRDELKKDPEATVRAVA